MTSSRDGKFSNFILRSSEFHPIFSMMIALSSCMETLRYFGISLGCSNAYLIVMGRVSYDFNHGDENETYV